jgi:ppGpp synthetase/RelA/SpoT-type nucleotidyltranferase
MEKLREFTKETIDLLIKDEDRLNTVMFDIQKIFREITKKSNGTIVGRVKSSDSLKEKIIRKSYHLRFSTGTELIENLEDIIGVRVLCLLHKDEEEMWASIIENFSLRNVSGVEYYVYKDSIWLKKDDMPVPQKNKHLLYKTQGFYKVKENRYNFELQIKSLVHLLWGEIEHMLFYKNYDYIIDSSFYSSVMDSFYDSLMNIDSQLKSITKQLTGKNGDILFSELRRMLARILYEKVNPSIEKLLGCKIDLRGCFDSVIEVVLSKHDIISYENCLEQLQVITMEINGIDLRKMEADVPKYTFTKPAKLKNVDQEISMLISNKIENDINWRIFVFLVAEACKLENDNDIFVFLSKYFIKIYWFNDDISELDPNQQKFITQANNKLILKLITNLDYNWLINNKGSIYDLLLKNTQIVANEINIDENEDISQATSLLSNLSYLIFCIDSNKDFQIDLLNEIQKQADNETWFPEKFMDYEFRTIIDLIKNNKTESCKNIGKMIKNQGGTK